MTATSPYIVLTKFERERFKEQLKSNLKIYQDILLKSIPKDIEGDAQAIRDAAFHRIANDPNLSLDGVDSESEKSLIDGFMEMLLFETKWINASYRVLLAWISITYQLWEQQLVSWVHQLIDTFAKVKVRYPKSLTEVKRFLNPNSKGINVEAFDSWSSIEVLARLVNVIKHAEGDSEEWLRMNAPDYFLCEKDHMTGDVDTYDRLKSTHTTIGICSLNVNNNDLRGFTECLCSFWDELHQKTEVEKVPFYDAGVYFTVPDLIPYERDAYYYVVFHIASARASLSHLTSDKFNQQNEFESIIEYYHYHCDHLLFSMGQISSRFIENNKDKNDASIMKEIKKANRSNFEFNKKNYPILSNRLGRNIIEHIDAKNAVAIDRHKGVGGFNVIMEGVEPEIIELRKRRETHIYTLDLLEKKILLYDTQKQSPCDISLDKLNDELENLSKRASNIKNQLFSSC